MAEEQEQIGTCEGCSAKIVAGDLYHHCTDGVDLCQTCAPMLSDILKQMDEYLAKPDGWMAYDDYADRGELQEARDRLFAEIAANGDRKAVAA